VRGYVPDRVIPAITTASLAPVLEALPRDLSSLFSKPQEVRSRCCHHSAPKRKHFRRTLSLPNPIHQIPLAHEIANSWHQLERFCDDLRFSMSNPREGASTEARAIVAANSRDEEASQRCLRSVGMRYLLRADLARFYPSIYTHSIGWALDGKATARANKSPTYIGNSLDRAVRNTQDRQTGGIPIGPDSSFVIGEVIATALDKRLAEELQNVAGTRFIDDYFLYLPSLAEAERALAVLHGAARELELEINDTKTEILELPDQVEPIWKARLRNMQISDGAGRQALDLIGFFNAAFSFGTQYPNDSVLTYAAKHTTDVKVQADNWPLYESLLLRCAQAEPSMLPVLGQLLTTYATEVALSSDKIARFLGEICRYHTRLQEGYEVAWSLWLAKSLGLSIPEGAAEEIPLIDDPVVALIALNLMDTGNLGRVDPARWSSWMTADELYSGHWIVAYEALTRGWLRSADGTDYVDDDPFFSLLARNGVSFYDAGSAGYGSWFGY
jgi:hypothetical protein